jgi:hypothetical protein
MENNGDAKVRPAPGQATTEESWILPSGTMTQDLFLQTLLRVAGNESFLSQKSALDS